MAMATALLILLLAAQVVYGAEQHIVGGSSRWSTTGNYKTWAAGETFMVGDTLVFNYDGNHKVDVVTKADYDNCATGNALNSYSNGSTTITLSTPGPMYFICPTFGHCAGGMKLAVNAVASSTPPKAAAPPSGSGTPGTTTPTGGTPSPPPPPPRSGAYGNSCNMNNLMLGCSLVLAAVLSFMG